MSGEATPSWFTNIIAGRCSPVIENGLWRVHPQLDEHFFADFLPREFLQILEDADKIGWQRAVRQGMPLLDARTADYTKDYFFESYRSNFVSDLGVGRDTLVLDVGCGWGFASQRCLEAGAYVVATDNSVKRLAFCNTRFKQQGFGERFVGVELDANREFPFENGKFDVIIVSGLVEWLPQTAAGQPDEVQRTFLRQVTDLLIEGGRLYLAIENRFWAPYFIGARDLHSLQRLTSILPRRIARAYSMLVAGVDYRVYTHSFARYIGMFRELGFRTLDAVYPEPDYVQPKHTTRLLRNLDLQRPKHRVALDVVAQVHDWRKALFGRSFMFTGVKG